MKKIFFLSTLAILSACSMYTEQYHSDEKLIKTVAFDSSCPADKIKIVSSDVDGGVMGSGSGRFIVEACGKQLKYLRTGTIYHAADKPLL